MHFTSRSREALIFKEVFCNHPKFSHCNIIFGDTNLESRPYTIEGGDIIVLSEQAIAVGCSQRTRTESIRKLATKLFNAPTTYTRVYEINIPVQRAYMHLDTVFTIVDNGLVVAYPNVMNEIKEITSASTTKIISIKFVYL
jgi:arginine deiminase